MTLLDRLILVAFIVVFAWQVVVPLWRDRPIFPIFRRAKAKKGLKP